MNLLSKLRNLIRVGLNWYIWKFANLWNPGKFKNWILRRMGANIHPGAWISPDVLIDPVFPEKITITKNSFIGWGVTVVTHMLYPISYEEAKKYIDNGEKVLNGMKLIELHKLWQDGAAIIIQPNDMIYRVIDGHILIDNFVGGFCTIEPGCEVKGVLRGHSYLRAFTEIKDNEIYQGIPAKFFDYTQIGKSGTKEQIEEVRKRSMNE